MFKLSATPLTASCRTTSTSFDELVHNGHGFTWEGTNMANIYEFMLWSSESDGEEVEQRRRFDEKTHYHHGTRSRLETAEAALYSRLEGSKRKYGYAMSAPITNRNVHGIFGVPLL